LVEGTRASATVNGKRYAAKSQHAPERELGRRMRAAGIQDGQGRVEYADGSEPLLFANFGVLGIGR
jgi:hypothetical protein